MPTKSSILRFFPVVGDFFQQKYQKQEQEKYGQQALVELQRRYDQGTMDPYFKDYAFRALQNQDAGLASNIIGYGQDPQMLENVKQTHTKGFMKGADEKWRNPSTGDRLFEGVESEEVLADQIAEAKRRQEVKKLGEMVSEMPEGSDQQHAQNLMNLGKPDAASDYLSNLTNPQMIEGAEMQRRKDEMALAEGASRIGDRNSQKARRVAQNSKTYAEVDDLQNLDSAAAREIGTTYVAENFAQLNTKMQERATFADLLSKLEASKIPTGPGDQYRSEWLVTNVDRETLDAMAIMASRGKLKEWKEVRPTDMDQQLALDTVLGADKTENFNINFIRAAIKEIDRQFELYDAFSDQYFSEFDTFKRPGREYHFTSRPQQ